MRSRVGAVVVAAAIGLAGCSISPGTSAPGDQAGVTGASPSSTAAATVAPDPRLGGFYRQALTWSGCGGEFECADLAVPRSYAAPDDGSLTLKVIRLRASGDDRLGSLVVNPGGPGGSGLDYARAARGVTSDAVRSRYDIVGFDPRGVGESDPIECLDDAQTDALIAADASPDTPAEVATLAEKSKEVGVGCETRSPTLVQHVGTIEAARDMDILRAALGDTQLNYLGKSYGTFLGATYAEMFPRNVGRMVLDGAIDPSLDATALARGQAAGFERALRSFVENCPSLGCTLPSDPDLALQQIRDLLARIDARPLPSDQPGRVLTEGLAVLGIVGSLYDRDSGWATLSDALAAAERGSGSELLAIGDFYTDRRPDGTYASNANDAIYAVNCWDKPATPGVTQTAAIADEWARQFPTFGAYLAWGNLPCATWPAHSTVTPHRVVAEGSPDILVIGTVRDPATPVEWAKALAGQLSRGVYLEWDGDGHTAYSRGSECIDTAVDAFLVEGTAPASGTVCE